MLANLPYVREDEWAGLAPEITRFEPRDALVSGPDGLDAIRALVASAGAGTRLALEHAPDQAAAVRGLLARRRDPPRPRAARARACVTVGAVRRERGGRRDLPALHRGRRRGAVPGRHRLRARHRAALARGRRRLYGLKGRRARAPLRGHVLRARAGAGGAARARRGAPARALEPLLPGPVTAVLPNPPGASRSPAAREPERLGLRVPRSRASCPLRGAELARAAVERKPERRPGRRERWPPWTRGSGTGVDMILDGGELPGTASTVVDLVDYEDDGRLPRCSARGAVSAE